MSEATHQPTGPRVVVVTGAAQGLGRGIAEEFLADGEHVALLDIDAEGLTHTAAELTGAGHTVIGIPCDVRSREAVDGALAEVATTYGRIDVAISNAGVLRDELLFRMTDDDWSTVIDTHLSGAFYLTRAAQKYMVEQRYGKIVLMSSRAALGSRGQVNYSAAKAGLQGMARSLAIELGPFGINVNAVAPGHVETAMTHSVADRLGIAYDDLKKTVIDANAIKRVGTVADVAKAVSFLASDDASYITGQVLYLTGRPTV